ncbi:hypothetical protein [Halalkalibacter akibai]|uniref:Uncharacterized protein n=1 Tax=Halalkalibacter akibai (strain ATCC 43226 / DSM 21942 / CIP 109018 / JCM 9157 / 1139) TaxID=1236973 RepID=W4R1H3_HALA3|nr:hypothetical protein [Halalkalibacter akibai]GAE37399.1 hypothetical protein JCM9157_4676 [Halalkalibacter akibai JCM 9157]
MQKTAREWTVREDAILLCHLRMYNKYVKSLQRGELGEKKLHFAKTLQDRYSDKLKDREPETIYPHLDYLLKLVKGEFTESKLDKLKKSDVENYHGLWSRAAV